MKDRSVYLKVLWILSIFLFSVVVVLGESKPEATTPPETRMTISYLYASNDTVTLTAGIMVKRETGPTYLANAVIDFFATGGSDTKKIGSIKSGATGTAILKYPVKNGIPRDKDGITTYSASFIGKGPFPASEEKISAKLAKINLKFNSQDSVHNIDVSAMEIEVNGKENPVAKQTVVLYVQRLFSLLKIGEVALDDAGKGSLEFPHHLIGDSTGVVLVYARIEDNDLYATVQGQNSINWGIPKH